MADKPIKGSPIAFSDKTIAKALTNIYRKKFNIKTEIEPELFLETVRLFNLASATGISDAVGAGTAMPNDDFLQAIKTNNEVFSAFRVHKMQNDIAKLMTDGDGKLKSFSKFAKDVKPYTNHKNRAWLQTEYNTAVLRAHQAADWQQFEREKDVLPNLEWMPSTSTHPGEDHRPFWGTILPIDDPFWNEHRPGDRWNCKCRLRSTGEPVCSPPNATSSNLTPNRGLENNPGKDGKIFSDKHPYMPQSCAACPFGHGKLWALAARKDKNCAECGRLEKAEEKANMNVKDTPMVELRKWYSNNLPFVSFGKFGAKRFEVTNKKTNDLIIINRHFYEEVVTHYQDAPDYNDKIRWAKKAHILIEEASLIEDNIPSNHHPESTFIKYDYTDNDVHIEFKCKKNNDGIFLHYMRLL